MLELEGPVPGDDPGGVASGGDLEEVEAGDGLGGWSQGGRDRGKFSPSLSTRLSAGSPTPRNQPESGPLRMWSVRSWGAASAAVTLSIAQ